MSLARVLDKIGGAFGQVVERAGVHWDATTDLSTRRDIALQILRQMPLLWIWDNVEPITGLPAGAKSEWSVEEQQELRAFLSAARDTKAKFLLTRAATKALAQRLAATSAGPTDANAGAAATRRCHRRASRQAARRSARLEAAAGFHSGNPLTILVAVSEALRAGIETKDHCDMTSKL